MLDCKICRICLRTECKVYKYDRFQLKPYYEEVMAMKMNENDGLPHYFCYECAVLLHKFHKFKEKCYIGQNVLKEISWRGEVTYEAVYKVDRAAKFLKSPLEVLSITRLIKTYHTKDETLKTDTDNESVKEEDEEKNRIQDLITNDCDDSMSDIDNRESQNKPSDSITKSIENEDNIKLEQHLNINEEINIDNKPKSPTTVIREEINNDISPNIPNTVIIPEESNDSSPNSPTTVFVQMNKSDNEVKSEIVKLKSEKIKLRRRSFSEYGVKKQNPAFSKKRTRFYNKDMWKKSSLSEEEAIKEFRIRSEDEKYMAAEFKCTDCFKWFRKEEILKRHKQLRHCESQCKAECRFCHMRFKWDCHLRKHLRTHFTKYQCLLCGLVCSAENTVLAHEEYHSGVVKKCMHCGEEFKHSSTYYTHLRTHRSEYLCTLCGMSFVSPLGLHTHKKIKHVNDDIESPDDDEEVNTYCQKCDIQFRTRKAYEEHLFHSAMHDEGVEDEIIDGAALPRKVLGKKLQAKITYSLKGRKSDETINLGPLKKRRRKEKRTHKKPTTCHQCGQHFNTQAACMKHHLSEHPGTSFYAPNERHICEICGASLAPGSVSVHINIHTKERMHPCETCGRTFHSAVGLKRHMVTHTGEKRFKCSLCDKRFTQSNSMKLHYRTIHLNLPYPKRNRRKKKDEIRDSEPQNTSSESDDSLPEAETETERVDPAPLNDNLHYLTLT